MLKFFKIFFLVSLLIFLGCAKKEEEVKKVEEFSIKTTERLKVVYVENVGPYWEVGPVFGKVAGYAMDKKIQGRMLGIFYDDPSVVPAESLRCEIGIEVPEEFVPDSGYIIKEIEPHLVVYAILKGPYEEIAKRYPEIKNWAEKKGYQVVGPVTEIYLKVGPEIPDTEFVTEVQFPVKEK